jgi:ABC-type transporter Mla MlaB component
MTSQFLKIYLHDNSDCFRIQLAGRLEGDDVKEVAGCWETSRSSIVGHPVILDLTRIEKVDSAGRTWLAKMKQEGAEFRDGKQVSTEPPARLMDDGTRTTSSPDKPKTRRRRSWFGISPKSVFDSTH